MTNSMSDFEDWLSEASRNLERKCERMTEEMQEMENYRKAFETASELIAENERLKEELETLRELLQEKDEKMAKLEIQLNEMSKLASGVAKKSSTDDVSKAFRIYLNTSKRKTQSKREASKTVLLELIATAKLELSEELMDMLYHLDDEQPEAKIVIEKAEDVIAEGGVKNVKTGTDD